MPKRKAPEPARPEIKQFRSAEEIKAGITKLKRRVEQVQQLQRTGVRYNDQAVYNAASDIGTTILEVFGLNSPEYREHGHHMIWRGGHYIGMPQHESQACFEAGVPQTVEMLSGLVRRLEEKRSDLSHDIQARARSAFEFMDLHPRVAIACADLYRNGHYKQAVLEASIALVNYVKERSRQHSLDGSKLMTTVFSANNPLLAFNELKDQTDKDEQEGFMHLFIGAVLALRNPRAHAIFDDSPEMALDYIAFLSMLAKRLEGARRI